MPTRPVTVTVLSERDYAVERERTGVVTGRVGITRSAGVWESQPARSVTPTMNPSARFMVPCPLVYLQLASPNTYPT